MLLAPVFALCSSDSLKIQASKFHAYLHTASAAIDGPLGRWISRADSYPLLVENVVTPPAQAIFHDLILLFSRIGAGITPLSTVTPGGDNDTCAGAFFCRF